MVAKNIAIISNAKTNDRTAHPDTAKWPQKHGKITTDFSSTPNHTISDLMKDHSYFEGHSISIALLKLVDFSSVMTYGDFTSVVIVTLKTAKTSFLLNFSEFSKRVSERFLLPHRLS